MLELSVVPATMLTGEPTAAPFVGVQIVTDGLAVLSVHCPWAADVNAMNAMEIMKKDAGRETEIFMFWTQYSVQFRSKPSATPECQARCYFDLSGGPRFVISR